MKYGQRISYELCRWYHLEGVWRVGGRQMESYWYKIQARKTEKDFFFFLEKQTNKK